MEGAAGGGWGCGGRRVDGGMGGMGWMRDGGMEEGERNKLRYGMRKNKFPRHLVVDKS